MTFSYVPASQSVDNSAKNTDYSLLLKHVLDIKATLEILCFRMRAVENKINSKQQSEEIAVDLNLLPNLPLQSIQELKNLEMRLEENKQCQNQLVRVVFSFDRGLLTKHFFQYIKLKFTGGTSEKHCINRCLEKIFSNFLGQFCSWKGQKKNFKVSNCKCVDIIKGTNL